MKSKYQQYSEQIAELEEAISRDEPEFLRIEKEFNEKQEKFNYWKESYNKESGKVVQKYFIVGIVSVVFLIANSIFHLATISQTWEIFFVLALPFLIGFAITCEDRDSRNTSEKFMKDCEKALWNIKPDYEKLKPKYEREKQKYEDLKEQFATWKTERENLLLELAGKKPYQYFDFPLDPVIDDYYYPVGTLDEPEKFMIYTANAHRYHKQRGCSGAYKFISIGEALENNQTPCLICFGYSNDFDYPDWIYTVHDKYFKLVHKLEKYDISAFIDSNHQLSVAIPIIEDLSTYTLPNPEDAIISEKLLISYFESGMKELIRMIWTYFHSLIILFKQVQLPIITNNIIAHLACLIHSIFRVALEEHLNYDWDGIKSDIDDFFINKLKIPNSKLYLSLYDFYYTYFFRVYFDLDKTYPHGYWQDDVFRQKYEESKNNPWYYMCLSRMVAFGDVIINDSLASDYNLTNIYFTCKSPIYSEKDLILYRNNIMTKLIDQLFDFFEDCWSLLDNWPV